MGFITFNRPRSSTETFYRKHLVILRPTKVTTQLLVGESEGVQSCRKQHQLYLQADPLRRSHWAPMLTPTVLSMELPPEYLGSRRVSQHLLTDCDKKQHSPKPGLKCCQFCTFCQHRSMISWVMNDPGFSLLFSLPLPR